MKTIKYILAALAIAAIAACGGGGGYGGGGMPVTYGISGAVSGGSTNNSGVTINLTGAATMSTTTPAGGAFSFAGLPNGNYTVTPVPSGHTFSPASRAVTISYDNPSGVNFTETP